MDFDTNLLINFVPIIFAATLTFVACITVFYKLRSRWPTKVNCWFCNSYTTIQRQSLDWWLCPCCEQYNGFSKDGDYNYEIPEQHESTNRKFNKHFFCERKDFSENQNSLCKQCNHKEELKLIKLRELEDSIDINNDKQIARFEKTFEKKFPLCSKCQNFVQRVLYKQGLWLTQNKMLLFKQKPIRRIVKNRENIGMILHIILSTLAFITIYYTEVWYLPLCGMFLQFVAHLASPINKRQSSVFPILGWACLISVRKFSLAEILQVFKINTNHWESTDDDMYNYFIITLGVAVSIANLRFRSNKTISNGSWTFKKLESPSISLSRSSTPEIILPSENTSNKEPARSMYSPVNITDTLMTPAAVEVPIPLKPTCLSQWSPNDSSYSSRLSSRGSHVASERSFRIIPNNESSLNASLTSLNSLSLGGKPSTSSLSPKVFETKVYGTSSPDLFSRGNISSKRSILAPAKLRSVTETSWVAGGYWQPGIDTYTLSRSSSQSSGLGSSREPSVQEFDQCSVQSEQFCFARPESQLSSRSHNSFLRQRSPRCNAPEHFFEDRSELNCSGHTTTIVTNPAWLPALLCGSLLFNMVVLCTVLLR